MKAAIRSLGPASVTGSLRDRPCAHLLAYVEDLALTGTLVFLGEPDGSTMGALSFIEGRIVRAYSVSPCYLSAVLYEQGEIGASEVNRALQAAARSGTLFGDEAVRLGYVTRARVDDAIVEQYLRKATSLVRLPASTRYAYHHGIDGLESYGRGDVRARPGNAVLRGLRGAPPSEAQRLVLSRFSPSTPLELVTSVRTRARTSSEALNELELDEDERAITEACVPPRSLESLSVVHGTRAVERIVYALLLLRRLRPVGTTVRMLATPAVEASHLFRPPSVDPPSGPRLRVACRGDDEPPSPAQLEAAAELRRAKGLVASRSFSQALRILESELVRTSSPLAEVEALTAWARAHVEPARSDESRAVLTNVIAREPGYGHAAYLLALLERAAGHEARALRLFAQAACADPNHIDAHRELRLYRLRRQR